MDARSLFESGRIFGWVGLGLCCLTSLSAAQPPAQPAAQPVAQSPVRLIAWTRGSVGQNGATLRQKPDASGAVLEHYAPRTPVVIYPKNQNGYYAIYIAKGLPHSGYAWALASELVVSPPPPVPPQNTPPNMTQNGNINPNRIQKKNDLAKAKSGPSKNRIRLGPTVFRFSPSDLQTTLRGTGAGFFSIGVSLGYERRVSRKFSLLVGVDRFSLTRALTGTSDTSATYSISGYSVAVGGAYYFYEKNALSIAGLISLGLSLSTVGNDTSLAEIQTSNIMAIPIVIGLAGDYALSGRFGAYVKVGYQLHSLGSVPALPVGTTVDTLASVNLSGIWSSLGVSYQF